MFTIDRIAYKSALSTAHPAEKTFLGLLPLLISIASTNMLLLAIVLCVNILLALAVAKIPAELYLKVLILPLFFLLSAVCGIAIVSLSAESTPLLHYASIGITSESANRALFVFLRSFSAFSGFLLMMLTTPLNEILCLMRLCKLPPIFIDLSALTYRFIFSFADNLIAIRTAQKARLGNRGFFISLRSLSFLILSLFQQLFRQNTLLSHALLARGYSGELQVLPPQKNCSVARLFTIVLFWGVILYFGHLFTEGGGR